MKPLLAVLSQDGTADGPYRPIVRRERQREPRCPVPDTSGRGPPAALPCAWHGDQNWLTGERLRHRSAGDRGPLRRRLHGPSNPRPRERRSSRQAAHCGQLISPRPLPRPALRHRARGPHRWRRSGRPRQRLGKSRQTAARRGREKRRSDTGSRRGRGGVGPSAPSHCAYSEGKWDSNGESDRLRPAHGRRR